jgi:PAS domain S-box-containing protein
MSNELRKTGISIVGDMPWGTHFCCFYETPQDLLALLGPYFATGLELGEFCVWVISDPLTEEDALRALRHAAPHLDRYLAEGSIEIISLNEWYLKGGVFDLHRVIASWNEKLDLALARGYTGMRVSGNTAWVQKKDWRDFRQYEKEVDVSIANQRMIVLCTYPLTASRAAEFLDVVRLHQVAVTRRSGNWEIVETPELKQAKQEIKRLNEELEQRVAERTRELRATNEELRKEITERTLAEAALRASQQQYESLVQSIDGIVWEVDARTFGFTFISKQAERILGYPLEQWFNEPNFWANHLHPGDRDWSVAFCMDAAERRVDHQFEYRMIAADGRVVWLRDIVTVHVMEDQCVRLRGIMVEITARKRAEALLHAKEQEFRAIVENAPDQIIRYDREFHRTYANPAVAKAYGLPAEALIGKPIGSVIQDAELDVKEDELAQIRQRIAAVFATGTSYEDEISWSTPTGRKYYNIRLFPERDLNGAVVNVLGIARDITARKHTEAERARLFAQLQLLSRQLLQAQEAERRTIARELHDEIGQRLTGLGLLLSNQRPSPDQLIEAQAVVRDLIARLRNLSLDLRPTILDDLGLLPALVWLFERYMAQTNVSVQFEHLLQEELRFEMDVETSAYRIVQEALTNVARHAGVHGVTVRLWTDTDTLWMVVADQGRGFDPQTVDPRASSGLAGMHERVALLGGSLTIESTVGAGTRLTATLPLHSGAGSDAQEQRP